MGSSKINFLWFDLLHLVLVEKLLQIIKVFKMKTSSHILGNFILPFFLFGISYAATVRRRSNNNNAKEIGFEWDNWNHCPDGLFVSGLGAKYLETGNLNMSIPKPLIGINMVCSNAMVDKPTKSIIISKTHKNESIDAVKLCTKSTHDGLLAGIQYKQHEKNNEISGFHKSILDLTIFCDDTQTLKRYAFLSKNFLVSGGFWKEPSLCGWGEYVCAIQAQYGGEDGDHITNIRVRCCTAFSIGIGWRSYRESAGKLFTTPIPHGANIINKNGEKDLDIHFNPKFDHPYYYKWQFCPISTFVTGMRLQYEKRRVQFLCSDMSRPKPRMSENIQMPELSSEIWEYDEDISDDAECDGVVIGLQFKYHPTDGIQGIRLICSFSNDENQLSFVEGRFPLNNKTGPGQWESSQMCEKNQAVCGFKALSSDLLFHNGQTNLLHMKVKCCNVPKMAEICFPQDNYELVVECDATQAWADSTCQYTQTEGISMSHGRSLSERREEQFRQSLSQEWTLTDGSNKREGHSVGGSVMYSLNQGTSSAQGHTNSEGSSRTDSDGRSLSHLTGHTATNTIGSGVSSTNTSGKGTTLEKTLGSGHSTTSGKTQGQSKGSSNTLVTGSSTSESDVNTLGSSDSSSTQDTKGISSGKMSAVAKGNSQSQSHGSSDTASSSNSNMQAASSSQSYSNTKERSSSMSVSAEVSANFYFVSASLKTSFESSERSSSTRDSENSRSSQSTQTNERSSTRNSNYGSESSLTSTSQQNEEKSASNTNTKGSERSKSSSSTKGKETNEQKTLSENEETSNQISNSKSEDNTSSATNRTNVDNSLQTNINTNKKESNSDNNQITREQNINRQNSTTSDISKSLTNTQNIDRQNQTSEQTTAEISTDLSSSSSHGETGTKDDGLTTGYDWGNTSSTTWNLEKSYQITMTIPAGMRTQLFQVVGKCAYYQIRTSKFKRVDYLADWAAEGLMKGNDDNPGGNVETTQR